MNSTGLEALLAVNGIDLAYCKQALYRALRNQCFSQICDILRSNREIYTESLHLYRTCMNSTLFAKMMVAKYCTCKLDSESYVALGKMFCAFFRKNGTRRVYPNSVRQHLLSKQDNKCAICNISITVEAELDHVIPWLYVGDELDDNLQMLCPRCNNKKRASAFYPLHALLCKIDKRSDESAA